MDVCARALFLYGLIYVSYLMSSLTTRILAGTSDAVAVVHHLVRYSWYEHHMVRTSFKLLKSSTTSLQHDGDTD
jgi:hypothetical protein